MYKRAEYQTIKSRLEESRRFIQVVVGARQIGKSTVVKQVLKDIDIPFQFFSADNVPATNSAWISNCWAAVRSLKENKGWDCVVLVIDEIQKIANWSEVVKKEWDADTFNDNNIKVLLLGSSRVLLENVCLLNFGNIRRSFSLRSRQVGGGLFCFPLSVLSRSWFVFFCLLFICFYVVDYYIL